MNTLTNHPSGTTPTPSNKTAPWPACAGRSAVPRAISTLCLVMVAGLVLAGCGKEKAPPVTQADTAPVNPEAPVDAQEKARVAQAVAFRQGIAPPAPSMTLRGGEPASPEVLAAYNQYLAGYIFKERDVPESLEEIAAKAQRQLLPKLPTPPPGKRLVYDGRNHIIRLDPP